MTVSEILGLTPLRPSIRTTPCGYQGCVGVAARGQTKLFTLSPEGRELAAQWSLSRKEKLRVTLRQTLGHNGEFPGVVFEGDRWRAQPPKGWPDQRIRSFSVAKYGDRKARKLAREVALKNWMKEA